MAKQPIAQRGIIAKQRINAFAEKASTPPAHSRNRFVKRRADQGEQQVDKTDSDRNFENWKTKHFTSKAFRIGRNDIPVQTKQFRNSWLKVSLLGTYFSKSRFRLADQFCMALLNQPKVQDVKLIRSAA